MKISVEIIDRKKRGGTNLFTQQSRTEHCGGQGEHRADLIDDGKDLGG